MFNRRTLFVVGAGASEEAGLPVGTGLAEIIKSKLTIDNSHGRPRVTGDPELFRQLCADKPHDINNYTEAFSRISGGILLSNSIDDFLHIHRSNRNVVEAGKACIVSAILDQELRSKLSGHLGDGIFTDPDLSRVADSWYVKLMRVLGPGTNVENVARVLDNVSFIVFNYDRCVEHFLQYALRNLYGITKGDAADIVRAATIIHPYGSIGTLDEVPFGDSERGGLLAISERIKTYTERIEERQTIETMRKEVAAARCIVFLGFAFHDQNMALLKPRRPLTKKEIYATALGHV